MIYETTLTREAAEHYRAAGLWPDRLLNDYFDDAVARQPDKAALVDPRGRLSYGELRDQACQAALAFLDLGVRKGDVVTVQLPNWNEFVVAMLALERIGAVIHPVAPIFRQRELRAMFRLAQPVAAVVAAQFRGFDYPSMYTELRTETPSLRNLIVVDGAAGSAGIPWARFLARGAALEPHRSLLDWLRPSPDEISQLIFTSGTTGEPKGVQHTANTLLSAAGALISGQRLASQDVFHMASTFGHQMGFLAGARLPLQVGATAIYQDLWDAAEFVRLIERERITFTGGATPFLADTLRAPNLASADTSSLRLFFCAGAPIPASLAGEAGRLLSCHLTPAWGMSEVGIVTAVLPGDPPEKIASSDGRAIPGAEVTILDAEGMPLPTGEEGDLYARGAFTFAGYVQGRRFTEQFFKPGGWFSTGDRARMDRDGYIRITGRSKDIIIRGGENVPVVEIESVLLRHPKVRTVALVAAPHERLGEIGCACVIPEDGETPTLDDLCAFLAAQQVTRQFWPERLELMTEFPMTPSGKVQKFQLRELVRMASLEPAI